MVSGSAWRGEWSVRSIGSGLVAESHWLSRALILLLLCGLAAPLRAETLVSGAIAVNTTWTLANSPYRVTSSVTVAAGARLTIEPGVRVLFNQYQGLFIDGELRAVGTAGQRISFTGTTETPGWWHGITVRNAGAAILEQAQVTYAGYWISAGVLKSGSGTLEVRASTLSQHGGDGLRIEGSTGVTTLSNTLFATSTNGLRLANAGTVTAANCTFQGNSAYGVLQDIGDTLGYAGNTFSGNTVGGVGLNGGTRTANLTLQPDGNPFRVLGNITLAETARLTLDPGVRVLFTQYHGFFVDGELHAVGTAGQPISFTGTTETPGWWQGIQVRNAGAATFEKVDLGYAGYWVSAGVLKSGSGALSLTNSRLHHVAGDGLRISSGASSFVSAGNHFADSNYGVRVGINASFDDNTSTFAGNNVDVYLDGGTIDRPVAWNQNPDYSLYVSGSLTVAAGASLSIGPGTVVKFAQYQGLYIDGDLTAVGTAAAPIHFTHWRDDSVGGDANQDGTASAPGTGWWAGVQIRNAGTATLEWIQVAWSGYWDSVGLRKLGSGALSLKHATLRHTAGDGLRIEGNTGEAILENAVFKANTNGLRLANAGSVTATDCLFQENTGYGVLQDVNDTLGYSGNTFSGNGVAGVGLNGGTRASDLTLQPGGNPFRVLNNITVGKDARLTLDPGVQLQFVQYHGLFIDGELSALGRADSPISFTGTQATAGWWQGVQIQNAGSATLDHCDLGYAGYWVSAGILKSGTGALSLTNSDLHDVSGDTLRIGAGSSSFVSANNRFSAANFGVRVGINASFDDNTSSFADNNVDVHLDGGIIDRAVVWNQNPGYSLFVSSNTTVAEGARLLIRPGTVVKFARYHGLYIDGELSAAGTAAAPIQLTDWRDDTVGGDANQDGSASTPGAGWWAGVQIRDRGQATLEQAHLRYSGYWDRVGVLKRGSGDLSLSHSSLSDIDGDALRLDGSSGSHLIERNSFSASNIGVLVRNQPAGLMLSGNRIEGNTSFGVKNETPAVVVVDARGNWWGHATGPHHPVLNASGQGDEVSDGVLFDPWRTTRSLALIRAPIRSGTLVAGDLLRFSGSALETPGATYRWDFGDGRTFQVQNPGLVNLPATGAHEVTYRAVIEGAPDPDSDLRVFTVVADSGSLADLRVMELRAPPSLAVGQVAQLDYSVRNVGDGAIGPTWRDALYLSADAELDIEDRLLGTLAVSRTLAAGASYQGSLSFTLPAVTEGAYHLILVANDEWQPLERHRLNNELASAVTARVPGLENGVTFDAPYGAGSVKQYYRMSLAEVRNLLLELLNLPSGLAVYLRYGALPTTRDYDARMINGKLVLPMATAGDWYVLIIGDVSTGGEYGLRFTTGDLLLTASLPARQGTASDLELTLSGAGFQTPLAVSLVSAGGVASAADEVEVISPTEALARFPAGSLSAGVYRVRVSRGGETRELANALQLIAGGLPKLDVRLILPAAFGYHQLATLYVEYANIGNAPMPAPLLLVTGTQKGKLGALLTLDQGRLSQGFWTAALPEGFANQVQFLASGARPGVLNPGETRRVPVYYAGWQQPWDMSYPPFDWDVGVLDTDNSHPVDWAAMKAGMRPSSIRADAWDLVWSNFTALAGATWGDYVAMLSRTARYLDQQGQRVEEIGELLAFAFQQADGLSLLSQLAESEDAQVTGPGLAISFQRVFAQPISQRFALGPLGRGWTHNWQYVLGTATDGTLTITGPSGAPRVFQPDSRYTGRYLAQPGDKGTLTAVSGGFLLTESDGTRQRFRTTGELDWLEDGNGNRITPTYTSGRLTRLEHNAGGGITLAYNGAGRISSVTDDLGLQTRYTYTGEYLTSVQADDGQTTTYAYQTSGAGQHGLTTIDLPDGTRRGFSYDSRGRLASTYQRTDQADRATLTYGDAGRISLTDALGQVSQFAFDGRGRLVKAENPLGEAVRLGFDAAGNLIALTDPEGIRSTFNYDRRGNLIEASDALRQVTRFSYTSLDRLASVTDANGNQTAYGYDSRGNLTSLTHPDGSRELWGYDTRGNPTAWTNRRGQPLGLTYDTAGRLLSKTLADGTLMTYDYDGRGNLTEAVGPEGTTRFTYDSLDRLTRIDDPLGRWQGFSYDAVGRRAASEDQLGYRLEYSYDGQGRLASVADGTGDLVTYAYDLLGRLETKTLGNGVTSRYDYDAAGRLVSLLNETASGTSLSSFSYSYDRRGRRISQETHYGTWTYSYDDLGQLTRGVLDSSDPAIPDQDLSYQYDALGNRIRTTVNGTDETYDANALNQYTRAGEHTYTYDLDGNLIQDAGPDGVTRYSYDQENRLVGLARGGEVWSYRYDALGNQIAVDENGAVTHYMIDPVGLGNLIGEYDAGGALRARYVHGEGLISGWSAGGSSVYYSFDPLGHASELTSPAGVVRNAYVYRPFGESLRQQQQVRNPFQIMGEAGILSDGSDLCRVRVRSYDVRQGRFTQPDPIGLLGGINVHGYGWNDPVSWIDPLGLFPFKPGFGPTFFEQLLIFRVIMTSGKAVEFLNIGLPFISGIKASSIAAAAQAFKDHQAVWELIRHLNPGALRHTLQEAGVSFAKRAVAQTTSMMPGGGVIVLKGIAVVGAFAAGYATGWYLDTYYPDNPISYAAYYWSKKICDWYYDVPATTGAAGTAGSQDPNQKLTIAGYGESNYVPAGTLLTYRVDFENDPKASAPAQVVQVTDALSEQLDWTSFELTEIGFGDVIVQVPPGLREYETSLDYVYQDAEYDFAIQVAVRAWIENGVVYANFISVDPATGLPPQDVRQGFLMPENDTGRGQGHIAYAIKHRPGLATGTSIRNVATIRFDFSRDIDTNQIDPLDPGKGTDPDKEALVTLDAVAPTSRVSPLPSVSYKPEINVTWSGQDDPSGSGIGAYAVYVQADGGSWTPWLTGTTQTSAMFAGSDGQTYGFYVVATDHAGNREVKTAAAEAVTRVAVPPPLAHPFGSTPGGYANSAASASGVVVATTLNAANQVVVFIDEHGHTDWSAQVLSETVVGPSPSGMPVAFIDPKDGLIQVAYPSASGLMLYQREPSGVWGLRNLTSEVGGGATTVAGQLTWLVSPPVGGEYGISELDADLISLVGTNLAGQLVKYAQRRVGGAVSWVFDNLTTRDFVPRGQPALGWVDEPVGYTTPWNGQNVAGVNAAGQVVVAWSGGPEGVWSVSKLSDFAPTPVLAGGLSAFVNWGINLTGVLSDGRLGMTWWSKQYEDEQRAAGSDQIWAFSILSDYAGGPRPVLAGESVVGLTTPNWVSNNAYGIAAGSGHLVAYWWSPGMDWNSADLNERVSGSDVPAGKLSGVAARDSTLSVFGVNARGEVLRFFWEPDTWRFENLSAAVAP